MARSVGWFSAGAASAIACRIFAPDVVAYCETNSEHPDNQRFLADCERAFGWNVQRLQSEEYADTWDVWERRNYISGPSGAPCTLELKVKPRLKFQRPDDLHVFGYTADRSDRNRADALRENWPDLSIATPLIDRGLTKEDCRGLLLREGVEEPLTYALGFPNANCMPCGKASGAGYWAMYRKHDPKGFNRIAELSRRKGAKLVWWKSDRIFLDELPSEANALTADAPACDFLCQLADLD